jgi:hypothetical protein
VLLLPLSKRQSGLMLASVGNLLQRSLRNRFRCHLSSPAMRGELAKASQGPKAQVRPPRSENRLIWRLFSGFEP